MFEKGEKIIYGKTGVCVVEDISERAVPGGKRLYYTLRPLYQSGNVIFAPADSDKIFMRPIITRQDAEKLIEDVPKIRESALSEEFSEETEIRSCEELLQLAISIYERRKEARRMKRKLSFTYENRLHRAEQVLFGELAAVLEVEPESVRGLLFAAIKD